MIAVASSKKRVAKVYRRRPRFARTNTIGITTSQAQTELAALDTHADPPRVCADLCMTSENCKWLMPPFLPDKEFLSTIAVEYAGANNACLIARLNSNTDYVAALRLSGTQGCCVSLGRPSECRHF